MRFANLRDSKSGQRMLSFVTDERVHYSIADTAQALGESLSQELLDANANTWLDPDALAQLSQLVDGLGSSPPNRLDLTRWQHGPPVHAPGKIIAVGRNYLAHVREGQEIWAKRGRKLDIPSHPTAFAKFASSLCGPYDDIPIPIGHSDVDYEVELAVVIGRPALNVSENEALEHVAGYLVCNDLAVRSIQRSEMEAQIGITLAKNFPNFAPMGPWLTSSDVVPDPQSLRVTLEVDGDVRQDANTCDMMFTVAKLVSYWSQVGLDRGDIIITGTPSGVALARDNPDDYYLRPGQLVVARIENLGELCNRMR